MAKPKGRFAYVRNPGGIVIDVPEKQLRETLSRRGFEFIGYADEAEAELEQLFSQDGNYQRPMADEADEVSALENGERFKRAPISRDRIGMKERETIRKGQKAKESRLGGVRRAKPQ